MRGEVSRSVIRGHDLETWGVIVGATVKTPARTHAHIQRKREEPKRTGMNGESKHTHTQSYTALCSCLSTPATCSGRANQHHLQWSYLPTPLTMVVLINTTYSGIF